ncbi:MAG: hypothetical protein ACRD29_26905 [Acidimicrobiales bacterium]
MGVLLDVRVIEGGRVAGRRAARSRMRAVLFFDLLIKNSKQLLNVAVVVPSRAAECRMVAHRHVLESGSRAARQGRPAGTRSEAERP